MYGKWVTLVSEHDMLIKVYVFCTPSTPEHELIAYALEHVRNKLVL